MAIYNYKGKKNVCGERIRELRIKKDISQTDLASRMQTRGVMLDRISLCRIEKGTRFVSDYEVKFFADILGCTPYYLLTGKGDIHTRG